MLLCIAILTNYNYACVSYTLYDVEAYFIICEILRTVRDAL